MWNKAQKLVYLKSSLDKDVANILWDYDKEEISSLSGLTSIPEEPLWRKVLRREKPDRTQEPER